MLLLSLVRHLWITCAHVPTHHRPCPSTWQPKHIAYLPSLVHAPPCEGFDPCQCHLSSKFSLHNISPPIRKPKNTWLRKPKPNFVFPTLISSYTLRHSLATYYTYATYPLVACGQAMQCEALCCTCAVCPQHKHYLQPHKPWQWVPHLCKATVFHCHIKLTWVCMHFNKTT